jgi:hypothetical protein
MNGKNVFDRKVEKAAEIPGEGLSQMQVMRKAQGLSKEIRDV